MKQPSMASSSSSPIFLIIFSMWMLISFSEAREYLVGGRQSLWKVPLPSPDSLSQWATSHRFRIGDAIIFNYNNRTESVHVVDEDDYLNCNTKGQHVVFYDGSTEVVFTNSGAHHFISGIERHCKMGLKLAVVVMSNTRLQPPPALSPSPSPSPSPHSSGGSQGADGNAGFIMWLGVSMAIMAFLI